MSENLSPYSWGQVFCKGSHESGNFHLPVICDSLASKKAWQMTAKEYKEMVISNVLSSHTCTKIECYTGCLLACTASQPSFTMSVQVCSHQKQEKRL